jgi:hypothetical protein
VGPTCRGRPLPPARALPPGRRPPPDPDASSPPPSLLNAPLAVRECAALTRALSRLFLSWKRPRTKASTGLNGGRRCARCPPPLRPSACPSALYKRRAPPPIPPTPLPPLSSPARALSGASPEPELRRPPLAVDLLLACFLLLSKLPGEFLLLSSSFWFLSHLISCMGALFRRRQLALRRTRTQRRREPPVSGLPAVRS